MRTTGEPVYEKKAKPFRTRPGRREVAQTPFKTSAVLVVGARETTSNGTADGSYVEHRLNQVHSHDTIGVLSRSSRQSSERRQQHHIVNDPSAGSPTETLLRLLLPLNDQV